jgi:hypothetical protein
MLFTTIEPSLIPSLVGFTIALSTAFIVLTECLLHGKLMGQFSLSANIFWGVLAAGIVCAGVAGLGYTQGNPLMFNVYSIIAGLVAAVLSTLVRGILRVFVPEKKSRRAKLRRSRRGAESLSSSGD